ncbi:MULTISPECIES: CGGC domain-containing protein [unclassified Fusibacter]|uniref:CGGC domain-containing protein n=1 Tax=unclassified Fusibacter TaxID=2624464 RepID=UPI0010127A26|nr:MULTISPECIES: CGGC domain-containing protein [unclassified Fusibacter]MCK8058990.1 CGGC domain-containing protein [Fusibacter sp. A2]NPE22401.1 CGGC domain-containing protein [Fusibacter sp. A1]RXV60508.1 CGGC domain-containing protein [Fusibacter sp. A1]
MKIAIIINESTADKCTGKGCLNAFHQRKDAFECYDEHVELVGFMHTGGDFEHKVKRLIENDVEVVHLSSCLRAKNDDYVQMAHELSKHFSVVGYSHGQRTGKSKEAIMVKKQVQP